MTEMRALVLGLFLLVAACAARPRPPARPAPTPLPAVAPATPAARVTAPRPPDPESIGPPEGYVEMRAVRVAALPQGDAVLLADAEESTVLPIFVGGTEALSIQLRLAHEPYERPLTHDLAESLVHELGGTIAKVQVDELRGTTFIGSVWLRHDGRLVPIDARPSDAIALALGAGVPVYVARTVLRAAGLPLGAPPVGGGAPATTPPPPGTF